jgi:hypothetical protein
MLKSNHTWSLCCGVFDGLSPRTSCDEHSDAPETAAGVSLLMIGACHGAIQSRNCTVPALGRGSRHALPEALRQGAPVGPRLVGGTSFAGKSAIDLAQIQILAQACLQGLDAARQVVFGWQRQGQSLEDIYMQGITPCARLLGDWWCADRLGFRHDHHRVGPFAAVAARLQQRVFARNAYAAQGLEPAFADRARALSTAWVCSCSASFSSARVGW